MAPTPDVPSGPERRRMRIELAAHAELFERMARSFPQWRGRRKRGENGSEGVPVNPDRPSHLTGGAAAALDFDDD